MSLGKLLRAVTHRPRFATRDVQVGKGVVFGRNVSFASKRVRIGDGCIFGDDVRVAASDFEIGDFGTIYFGCFFPGPGTLKIGHNFWLGNNSIVDSLGGTTIADNVGVGAHSQLWTHMKFGDVVAGCRFDSARPLVIGKDAWLVGHNLVSPVTIGERALVMLGSLVTKDIGADRTVAGVPAQDVTEKIGSQFEPVTPEQRRQRFDTLVAEFASTPAGRDAGSRIAFGTQAKAGVTTFDLERRTYTKTGSEFERSLLRHLLPRAKFTPV